MQSRGRIILWSARTWLIVWGSILALAVSTVAIIVLTAGHPRHFAGQYRFGGLFDIRTTVSITQAFHDHWIVPPSDIRNLKYAANSGGYTYPYPFVAIFTFPCSEADGFVKVNNLQYGGAGPDWPSQDVDVLIFAKSQGWRSADRLARWYSRPVPEEPTEYEQLMITGRSVCTVYFSSS